MREVVVSCSPRDSVSWRGGIREPRLQGRDSWEGEREGGRWREKGGSHTLPARGASLGPLGEEDSILLLCDAQREDLRSLDFHTAWGTYGLRKSSRA